MPVRALLRMVTVDNATEPYNHAQLKIFYPALSASTQEHQRTGVLPFDTNWSPAPIVIFLPGVNCSAHTYEWLANELANCGIVTVLLSWIAENLRGRFSVSPGIDIDSIHRDNYGSCPTSSSLPSIFEALKALQEDSILSDNLREDVILGGHSAGGTMALQNANHDWFPNVVGAFAYCANPLATSALGNWGKGNIPPLPTDVPILIMGASNDGIGNHHVNVFGDTGENGAEYIVRIFDETGYQNGTLCIFNGANHHTMCYPLDTSIGRIFMDDEPSGDENLIRQEMSQLIQEFISSIVSQEILNKPTTATIWKQV